MLSLLFQEKSNTFIGKEIEGDSYLYPGCIITPKIDPLPPEYVVFMTFMH